MDRKMETGTASMDSLLLGGGVQGTKERNLSASQPLVVLFKLYMLHQAFPTFCFPLFCYKTNCTHVLVQMGNTVVQE